MVEERNGARQGSRGRSEGGGTCHRFTACWYVDRGRAHGPRRAGASVKNNIYTFKQARLVLGRGGAGTGGQFPDLRSRTYFPGWCSGVTAWSQSPVGIGGQSAAYSAYSIVTKKSTKQHRRQFLTRVASALSLRPVLQGLPELRSNPAFNKRDGTYGKTVEHSGRRSCCFTKPQQDGSDLGGGE